MPAFTTLPAPSLHNAQPATDLRPVSFVGTGPIVADIEPVITTISRRSRWRIAARWLLFAALLAAGVGVYIYTRLSNKPLPAGIVSSNGRLEATEIDISTKLAGRIEAVLLQEGDFVERGQIVARMDTTVLRAQLREAQSDASRARMALNTANAVVEQRRNELLWRRAFCAAHNSWCRAISSAPRNWTRIRHRSMLPPRP